VSAVTGEGIDDLLAAIGDQLRAMTEVYELFVPWARGDILAAAHREGEVLTETTEDDGMRILARFEPASAKRLGEFLVRKVDN
jgi:GTP-binding protein HflX